MTQWIFKQLFNDGLAKLVDTLFEHYYSVAFHAIVGIVTVATIMIIPFGSFTESTTQFSVNSICLVIGVGSALLLDRLNSGVNKEGY